MNRRLAPFLLTAAALAASLAACAPASAPAPPPAARVPGFDGVPLPAGAVLDDPGVEPQSEFRDASGWEGSLRPDGATPQQRVPDVVTRGRLVVGVDQSQYLLSYLDVTTGNLRGFEIDLAREIATDIFGDPDKVDLRFVGPQSREHSLEDNDVDIVVRTMSVTPERVDRVDFSTPYLTSSVRLLVPRDRGISGAEDLPGRTVCAADGTTLLQMAREIAPDSPILRAHSWADCLMAAQQFHADAVLADDAILAGMAAQDPYMEILPHTFGTQSFAVGVHKGNDGMTRQVNATIERLRRDGTWDAMFKRWLAGSMTSPELPAPSYRGESGASTTTTTEEAQ